MIPEFKSDGKLPPGVHTCTWEEFIERFGQTPYRYNLTMGLKSAIEQLKSSSCTVIYIDGSFVTDKLIPGDFDACWDTNGVDLNKLKSIAPTLLEFSNKRAAQKAQYGGEFFPAGWPADSVGTIFLDFFQKDRDGTPKGIISIELIRH